MTLPAFLFLISFLTVSSLACHFDWPPPVPSSVPSPTSPRHQSVDEDRLFRQFRLDIIKEKMLRSLGMISAPRLSSPSKMGSPSLPSLSSNYLRSDLKRLPLPQHRVPRDPSANPRSSRVIVFAELGSSFRGGMCREPSNVTMSKELSTLSFKLPHSPVLIRNAILWYKTTNLHEMPTSTTSGQAWLCPCTTTAVTTQHEVSGDCMKLMSSSAVSKISSGTISRGPAFGSQKGWSSIRLSEFGSKVGPLIRPDRRILFVLGDKIRMTERKRPFLVLEVGNETPKRTKRSAAQVDCSADRADSCCRTRFWVDIRQLGWADWIISPAGFYYHYCKGHCTQGFDSIVQSEPMASATGVGAAGPLDYSQVMNAYVRRFGLNLKPCCVPRKMSHLPVVITTDGLTMNRTYIPNFIVNECACLGVA